MQIRKTETGWTLEAEQLFPLSREELFEYFADAGNLEDITPPWLHFQILTPLPIEMCEGALIDYQIQLYRIPITWRTEITVWEPPYRFVDKQLRGPYTKWVHEHTFADHPAGTLMTDRVDYAVPGGAFVNSMFVQKSLERIFEFRRETLSRRFCTLHKVGG